MHNYGLRLLKRTLFSLFKLYSLRLDKRLRIPFLKVAVVWFKFNSCSLQSLLHLGEQLNVLVLRGVGSWDDVRLGSAPIKSFLGLFYFGLVLDSNVLLVSSYLLKVLFHSIRPGNDCYVCSKHYLVARGHEHPINKSSLGLIHIGIKELFTYQFLGFLSIFSYIVI